MSQHQQTPATEDEETPAEDQETDDLITAVLLYIIQVEEEGTSPP
jgi:hypothetical protein